MYNVIENPVMMTETEIREAFDGKWVYIANVNFTPYRELLGGVPVVVADRIFEDQADGFFDEFRDKKYAPRADWDFTEPTPDLVNAFFGSFGGEEI